jgi:alpha-L-fucosidase 2
MRGKRRQGLRQRICLPSGLSLLMTLAAPGALASGRHASSGRWVIHSRQPAREWEHGMVTGNGRHGARVMGHTDNERIIINHEALFVRFWDRRKEMVADIAGLLPEVRRLIDEGKEKEAYLLANTEAKKQLTEKGRKFRKAVIPHPAFDLHIQHRSSGTPSGYRRQLDLETGEAMTRWNDGGGGVRQRVFSSRSHDVNVVQLKGTGGRKLDVTLFLKQVTRNSRSIHGVSKKDYTKPPKTAAAPGSLYYDVEYGFDPGGYEGVARVTTKGGKMSAGDDRLTVTGADEILIVIRVLPQKDGSVVQRESIRRELAGLPADYDEMFVPHAREHGEMFRRVVLDLGAARQWATTSTEELIEASSKQGVTPLFLELVHAMGRYLLISSCGRYPSPLQGIWGGNWSPPWQGGFVLDSNVNLQISAAAMGNLPECARSYFNYIKGMLPGWRLNARRYLGCRGFLAGNYADPETGYLVHLGNQMGWMYWPGGAGWNIHPFYDYALLTGDRQFMRKEVLPLYLEIADFYEDYMVKGKDGCFHIYPGVSPENSPRGMPKTLKDSTFDLAVAREVFRILIELGEQFKVDHKRIKKWKDYRERIAPYRINKDGALAEWAPEKYGEYYKHRHLSHLIMVYPWWEFSLPGADPELREAAAVALDRRFRFDARETHGLMHVALMATRLKDVEKVRINLHRLASRRYFYTNMATSCRPGQKICNLDASLSLPRLLMEMLVFSRPGHIELLPAWPKEYPDGSLRGVLVRGGHKLDLTWAAGKVVSATFHAGRDDSGTVCHRGIEKAFEFKAGTRYTFHGGLHER